MAFTKKNLIEFVKVALQYNASDIHVRTDESPCFRIRGDLVPVQTKTFKRDDVVSLCKLMTDEETAKRVIEEKEEIDGSFTVENLCRIRFNFFMYQTRIGAILRLIKNDVPSIEQLELSSAVEKIAEHKRGLVLVTGATGSGKSTTLAAMVNHINKTRNCHIITLEDPVEYIHPQLKSRISQREIGLDTNDFGQALRAALRQDPDVILIGEMRDPETISIALKAAETGHLVLATVHTTNAITTIGRVISMFHPSEQKDIRKRLAENLYATVSQRMLKSREKGKVVVAQEIMVTTPGIRDCIEGKDDLSGIYTFIKNGRGKGGNGSQTFDQHIFDLYKAKKISKDTATSASTSQSDFLHKLLIE